jgi:hypothetical protein
VVLQPEVSGAIGPVDFLGSRRVVERQVASITSELQDYAKHAEHGVGLARRPFGHDIAPLEKTTANLWVIHGLERAGASKLASAGLNHAFGRLNAPLVVSRAAAGNKPSQGLMKKLGMRRRRDLDYRPRGENAKLVVFSLSAQQWRERL